MRRSLPFRLFSLSLLAASFAVGCSGSEDERVGVSEDLLTIEPTLSEHTVVLADRLEFPLSASDTVLALRPGRILAGGPSQKSASASSTNPYGFLRRVKTVKRGVDAIVVTTEPASLTDAFKGEVEIENSDRKVAPVVNNGGLGEQSWTDGLARKVALEGGKVLLKKVVVDGLPDYRYGGSQKASGWDVSATIASGSYMDFEPGVSTSLKLSRGSLKSVRVFATGTLDALIAIKVDVGVEGAETTTSADAGWSPTQHIEQQVFSFPRQRWFQMVGFVPVWEALQVSLMLRCDLAFKGEMHGTIGVRALGFVGAGGEFTEEHGLRTLREGPTFTAEPVWNIRTPGSLQAKCSLTPEIALYVYDIAGPTVGFGPYFDARLDRTATGTKWQLRPAVRADVGVRASLLGWDAVDEQKEIFDLSVGRLLTGTL